MSSMYDFTVEKNGNQVRLDAYKGKVLVIANTASKCGLTPQYDDLQKLYERYQEQGLEILGFPCNQFADQEPGSSADAQAFCQINYGVKFPIFDKVDVRDEKAHPLFTYLTQKAPFEGFDSSAKQLNQFLEAKFPDFLEGDSIKWNFTKFLIDREGHVVKRFEPSIVPMDMEESIKALL
jgi:glutathione peroxidase